MRVKRPVYSGAVCEIEVYDIPDRTINICPAEPKKPRFKNNEERERHRMGIARRDHIRKFNENVDPSWFYSTLTCDSRNEIHSLEEGYEEGTLLLRRLKYRNPEAKVFLYMGKGRRKKRVHFHMVTWGLTKEQVESAWTLGKVEHFDPLRERNIYNGVDCGRDYTGLANYLFDHWTPEHPGRSHYRCTTNMRQPEKDDAKEAKRKYSEKRPPVTPKGYRYIGCTDNKAGYLCFKYVYENGKEEPPRLKKRTRKRQSRR